MNTFQHAWTDLITALGTVRPLTWCAVLLVLTSLTYAMGLLWSAGRGRARSPRPARPTVLRATDDASEYHPRVVFMLPCLNEAKVIGASVDRLLSLPYDDAHVMVINDGSDDETAQIVQARQVDPRVRLLNRVLPEARQGKGEALNAAVRVLLNSDLARDVDPADIIVVIVDADGRLEIDALAQVLPYFADPGVGGVQIGVRINNRHVNRLARMQDMEFVIYTDVFQKGRRLLGSVGLGGNGQFMRLSALTSLGDTPWSRSLTEDLDLGVRLLIGGWRTDYCPTVAVHQQGVVDIKRLLKQRTRWFQGGLQAWRLLPSVAHSVTGRARFDLLYLLTAPFLLLLASLLTLSFAFGISAVLVRGDMPSLGQMLATYALGFVPTLILAHVYFERERDEGVYKAEVVGLSHLYVLYGLMWYLCGWWAVWRMITRQTGWVKTARSTETSANTRSPDDASRAAAAVDLDSSPATTTTS